MYCPLRGIEFFTYSAFDIINKNVIKDLDKFNYEKGDTEGIVNYGLSIKDIKFAIIFMENIKDDVIRISLRSRGDFDVNEFSKNVFGGGGHKNAAGAVSKLGLNETINYFLKSIENYKELLNS